MAAASALSSLASAIRQAGGDGTKPFFLNAKFLRDGLNDDSVLLPADFDKTLIAAYQLGAATALPVTVNGKNVGPVGDSSFSVTSASAPLFGLAVAGQVTLIFSLAQESGKTWLGVLIAAAPSGFAWDALSAFMDTWPFDEIGGFSDPILVFSTRKGDYAWNKTKLALLDGPVQNFGVNIAVPKAIGSLIALIEGFNPPTSAIAMTGHLDYGRVDGENILYPTADLRASLGSGTFKLFDFDIKTPWVGLLLPAPQKASDGESGLFEEEGSEDQADESFDQAPTLYLGVELDVDKGDGTQIGYELAASIAAKADEAGAAVTPFSFTILPAEDKGLLTPGAMLALVPGGANFLAATPAPLQQFLGGVGLRGLAVSGAVAKKKPQISAIDLTIGCDTNVISAKTPWVLFQDPTGGVEFAVTDFELDWSVKPVEKAAPQQSLVVRTEFLLASKVFSDPFSVQITSDMQIYADYPGVISLSALLNGFGGVALPPSSGDVEISDISLTLDAANKSYRFSAGLALELDFVKIDGKPILSLSGGLVALSANTPSTGGAKLPRDASKTIYSYSFSGVIGVGPLLARASVDYSGDATPPQWRLQAALAQPLEIEELVKQFLNLTNYDFPKFLPNDLTIKQLSVDAKIGAGKQGKASYSILADFTWSASIASEAISSEAQLGLQYDGDKSAFSGSAIGDWDFKSISSKLQIGYQFKPAGAKETDQLLWVAWEGLKATYDSQKQNLTFTLSGWTIGTLLQTLVRTLGDPYFTLASPWDFLNKISLDGLSLIVDLSKNPPARITASYTLSAPVDLVFITITAFNFGRDEATKKILLSVKAQAPGPLEKSFGDLLNPDKGQDVQNMPPVPGRGQEYFKLFLFMMGQRVAVAGVADANSTKAVIDKLKKIPATQGDDNPVDPNGADIGYDESNNWLIAGHIGLLKAGNDWTVDLEFVFNDPELYGLRLALAGEKAKALGGLEIDVLYKKISDTLGVYQIEYSFPSFLRNLNFGSVAITLPQIGLKVYTNGDFFIDVGFPYNLDFTRSFSISAVIYFVPVLGSGGFYFGKLSAATSTVTPKTKLGTFDPVFVFGLGLQLGLGYYFQKGPLSAGFSLTVFGLLEGVVAPWHPYDQKAIGNGAVQSSFYFRISGTFGIIGLLYGKVDFAIISASLNVRIVLSVQIAYEAYHPILIAVSASVSVSLTVKIDLAIFSISIDLAFSTQVSASFVIDAGGGTPPWGLDDASRRRLARIKRATRLPHRLLLRRPARLAPKRVVRAANDPAPTLTLCVAPQFTVLAPEGARRLDQQEGAFVFLFAMDSPSALNEPKDDAGKTSFETFCAALFPWLIDSLANPEGDAVLLSSVVEQSVSVDQLDEWMRRLADVADPAFDIGDLLSFMADAFKLDIVMKKARGAEGDDARYMIFPVFDGLSLTIPTSAKAGNGATIDFETYVTANESYRAAVAEQFNQLAARIEQEQAKPEPLDAPASTAPQSMASFIFVDAIMVVARQLLNAARQALDSFPYDLEARGAALQDIKTFVGAQFDAEDIAEPNKNVALATGGMILIGGLTTTIPSNATLETLAKQFSDDQKPPRWATTAEALVLTNPNARIVLPGVTVSIGDGLSTTQTVTGPGASFATIAADLQVDLSTLARSDDFANLLGLLAPGAALTIPPLTYSCGQGDTLASIAQQFGVSVVDVLNGADGGLAFDVTKTKAIEIAKLSSLPVRDLWQAIGTAEEIGHIAGMVSRYVMYGLRLPLLDGLTLGPQFLYPQDAKDYALYQLTGQQFPAPADGGDVLHATLSRADAAHGVDLSFIQFDGEPTKSLVVDLSGSYGLLKAVLKEAKAGVFAPSPSFTPLAGERLQAKTFALQTMAPWTTSDLQSLATITGGAASLAANRPALWTLPDALIAALVTQDETVSRLFPAYADRVGYLPAYAPSAATTNPATDLTTLEPLDHFAFATRIDLTLRKLPQQPDPAPPTPTANDILPLGPGNSGPSTPPAAPNTYELNGVAAADALRLQELLSAMNSPDGLGEGILTGLFLLYQNPDAPGLLSHGADEFTAFLSQTNLSTESSPPPLFDARRRRVALGRDAIANPRAQFIKLVWEQSVVRAGGYYLTYELTKSGEGLPATLFDANGVATLTMVVTYSRAVDKGLRGRLASFVNALVTLDPLQQGAGLVAASQSTQTVGAPLASPASLRETAEAYGMSAGAFVERNATLSLATGALVPIRRVTHLLAPADFIGPDTALERLAAYYSAGAQTKILPDAIRDYNPGVAIEVGQALFIPPFDYVVSPSVAPGTTLGAMAKYYGLSLDEMAMLAGEVPGLLPTGARPSVDSQAFDLSAEAADANIAIELQRENLGPPGKSTDPDYAKRFLSQLYSTLAAGLAENAFFAVSPAALPFGPQDHAKVGSEPGRAAAALAAQRRGTARRERLEALALEPFVFRQTLGLNAEYALLNAAPDTSSNKDLPQRKDNPYIGVGAPAQIELAWRDLFGNQTVTPFEAPPAGYAGALNRAVVPVRYTDRIVPPARWPNTQLTHFYDAGLDADRPTLVIDFALDVTAYTPSGEANDPRLETTPLNTPSWLQAAKDDLARYTRVYFQINQDYSGLGLPGVEGQATRFGLRNALLATPERPLSEEEAQHIRCYVNDCIRYLAKRARGEDGGAAPACALRLGVRFSELAAANIVPLDLALTISRNPSLVDPGMADLADGVEVSSNILPRPDSKKAPTQSFVEYSQSFEASFQVAGRWRMKVATGLASAGAASPARAQALWAVRLGEQPGEGIHYRLSERPDYYAPRPLVTSLQSSTVEIFLGYETGKPYPPTKTTTYAFTGVDLNVWFGLCLQATDEFLSPTFVRPAFILDKLQGAQDPLEDGQLGKILKFKARLAKAIASTVIPVLSNTPPDSSSIVTAGETLRQALLNRLSNAYEVSAVVVFDADDVSGGPPSGAAGPANLYGQPQAQLASATPKNLADATPGNVNFSLSAAKLPLGEKKGANGETIEPRLAFLFQSKNVTAQAYVPLTAAYEIGHVEFDRRQAPGIDGFVQSSWLAFVTGPISQPLGGGATINAPVVLRALPTPPTMLAQSAQPTPIHQPPKPEELAFWTYSFDYTQERAAQDSVAVTVEFNQASSALALMSDSEARLMTMLAQFVTVYPAVARDLNDWLRKIDVDMSDPTTEANAKAAVDAFVYLLGQVTDAFEDWAKPSPSIMARSGAPAIKFAFEAKLSKDGELAQSELLNFSINGKPAQYDPATNTFSDGNYVLPAPVVAIDPASYTPVAVEKPPKNTVIAYQYELTKSEKPKPRLKFADALNIPARTVSMPDLNVFWLQNAWSSLVVARNKFLQPDGVDAVSTNPAFIFASPSVRFADPIVPHLALKKFDLGSLFTGARSLEDALNLFFSALFEARSGASLLVSIEATYAYSLRPDIENFPLTVLPIAMLAPTPTTTGDKTFPFAGALAQFVDQWRKRSVIATGGEFDFRMWFYGGDRTDLLQPLLNVDRVYIGADRLTPPLLHESDADSPAGGRRAHGGR